MTHLPLYIDVEGKRVTIFGGGMVGERRARLFLEHGAQVVVAAERFSKGLEELASRGRIELVRLRVPGDEDLARRLVRESWLVVLAMSSSEANRIIAGIAMDEGVMVNNATSAMEGDVIIPFRATVWGGIHLASTSLGEAGIAARRALEEAAKHLESRGDLETLYHAMRTVKRIMKQVIQDPKKRFKLYFEIAEDEEFKKAVEQGDQEAAVERALEIIREHAA
ncbi:MAG: bifunctional precorrin-2 dehydrogenase/sirohydrochlorin ferrochelatase [Desulfurococcales archaeon]|nr:bifunctional precorrin-2 dehydrogenase/sirohydrochlorin ferrochelatase [Desulfurococcales archaeon]